MNETENQHTTEPGALSPTAMKQCCAAVYESDAVKLLLGELAASGRRRNDRAARPHVRLEAAKRHAGERGLGNKVILYCGDAERLPFADGSFDAIVCECALCTFPNKQSAAAEFARVLRVGGQVGLSDLTRQGTLPPELESLVAWIACIADAQPLVEYAALLAAAGLKVMATEEHNGALVDFVNQIRTRLLVTEVMVGLNKLALSGVDIAMVKDFTRHELEAIRAGK